MNLLKSLKLQFWPPVLNDPDFGQLTFMYIAGHPERSYWEAEWKFPPTGKPVGISLDGDESGPQSAAREWYLGLPARLEKVLQFAEPQLEKALKIWLEHELPEDVFSIVELSGFGVEDPHGEPVVWSISFETTGEKWLGITIPFVGDVAGEAVVDT